MKPKIYFLLAIVNMLSPAFVNAQSCANYSVARTTGITYSSISGSSLSYFTWRNTTSNQDDDNRSYQEPIGFDFWYLGVRHTQFSANLNGTIDFSSSTSNGNNGGSGPYGPNYNNLFTTANMSILCLAPMYDDLWTAGGGTTPVASSIFYKTTGSAPNRVLTVEWENFDRKNSSTGSVNLQVKIYETTGKIEFIYGTMTEGTAAFSYACGINGNWTGGGSNPQILLTQQTANTTTFNNTPKNNLSVLPTANSKLSFTPPVPNGTPAGLTFTAVSKTGMTLHWTDHATNEIGFAIYHSTDSIDFIYAGETAANATSAVITGLLPSTTYYWQVHAVTEGDLGTALTGTQATLPAGIITSVATGNWGNNATWDCHCVPTLGDDITIANGHTVTLDLNGVCNMLTVGQGASGSLIIGNNATARTLSVDSDIVVHTGATVIIGTTVATHSIILDDDIINNGTLDLAPTSTRVCNVTFNNDDDSDQIISGTGAITNFNRVTVNMGSYANKLEITSSHFTAASNFLTLTNGIFKLSSAATVTPFTGNTIIPLYTGFWLNNAGATVSVTGGSITLLGSISITNGIFNIGNAADHNLLFDNGNLIMDGGAMNIAGRFDKLGITALSNLAMTAGTLTLATVGSTTSGEAPFQMDEIGSNLTMSGGAIIIRNPGAGNLGYVNTGGTNGTITGGTVQIGDALTPASQTFQINSAFAIPNLTVGNGVAVTAQLVTNPLTVKNNVSINVGSLNSNSLNITLGGNWINNAGFTAGTNTVTFNGTESQAISGTSGTSFNNLTINNTSGINLSQNQTVNSTLTLSAGTLNVGSNNLTITGSNVIAGSPFSATKMIIANAGGEVRKSFSSTGSYSFPIGDNTGTAEYSPVTLNFTAGTFAGGAYAGVKVTNAKNINNASSTDFLNRYWTVSNSGITSPSFNVTATYLSADIAGTETNIAAALFNSVLPWIKYSTIASNTLITAAITNTGSGIILSGISNKIPNVSISGGGISICTGGSASLNSTVTNNGTGSVTYSWSPATGLSSSTISNPVATPTITTTYTLTVTDANGSTASASAIITVNSSSVGGAVSGNATVCSNGNSGTLTLSGQTGSVIRWESSINGGANWNAIANTTTSQTYTNITQTTEYRAVVQNGVCTTANSAVATITVTAAPSAIISYTGSPYCSNGGIATVTRTGTSGGTYSSTAGLMINSSTGTITLSTSTAGTYTVTYTFVAAGGCSGYQASTVVSILADGTWTGSASTNWNTGSNWLCGIIPSSSTNVTIAAGLTNYPLLNSGTGSAKNITIQSGASLTLTGSTLQIAGSISNSGIIYATDGTIEMNGIAAQTIPSAAFSGKLIKNLVINNTAGVTLADTLKITQKLSVTSGSLATGGFLVLKSSDTASASVSQITSAASTPVSGNVTVERYIPGRRKYRLITSPVTTSANTTLFAGQEGLSIWGNWQNGGINTTPNLGTLITGGTVAGGFDQGTANASIYTYDDVNRVFRAFSSANGKNTKYTPLKAGIAYLMFVYGDRLNSVSATNPHNTVLKSVGTLKTGDQIYDTASAIPLSGVNGRFTLLGNPFASVIDWTTLPKTSISDTYWGWDPNLSNTGGYVTVSTLGGVTVQAPYSGSAGLNQYIQSGQGFFVKTIGISPALTIREQDKVSEFNASAFRSQQQGFPLLAVNLQYSSNGTTTLADGVLAVFDSAFSNIPGNEDATKISNSAESMAILNNATALSIDARKMPTENESLLLNISRLTKPQYNLQIFAEQMQGSGLLAFLEDSYLGTQQPLSLNDTNNIVININAAIPASYDISRFRIVFQSSVVVLPMRFIDVKAAQKNKDIEVDWYVAEEINIKRYEIERSADGVNFSKTAELAATRNYNSQSYHWLDTKPLTGNNYYRIRAIETGGNALLSKIVSVKKGITVSDLYVFPNPVTNHQINIRADELSKGTYHLLLQNQQGQEVMKRLIDHIGGGFNKTIELNKMLPSGIYYMQLVGKDEKHLLKILVK